MSLRRVEVLGTLPAAAFRGTFAPSAPEPVPGADVPPGWEGLYFPYDVPLADLRPDGTPVRDGVLPEIDLPRRMYAGEDAVFHRALRYGEAAEQVVTAGDVVRKTGRSGELVFADVVREYLVDGVPAVTSTWHDVFMDVSTASESASAGSRWGSGSTAVARPGQAASPSSRSMTGADPASGADWSEPVRLDERQLFRFSALTFNTHRVHYDVTWARDVEGLGGLVVHGPLLRILLLDAAIRHEADPAGSGRRVAEFSFRVRAPLLAGAEAVIAGTRGGQESEVRLLDADGGPLARGVVTWSA